ncbi:MAG TPA: DUF4395 family protein [Candidatus Binatia bacterium]|nr:DUF4395 family protein [Candidatus Binatia bacterium]
MIGARQNDLRSRAIRTADPYRDLDVIDERAPRFNQATVGIVSLVAVAGDWWPLLGLMAAQLAIGLRLGRRYCLPCLVYFELVQPRFGEGPIEDSRPPRFANQVGMTFLGTAAVAGALGWMAVADLLGLLVALLALLAAISGFCLGCQIYRLAAQLGVGRRRSPLDRIELEELGLGDLPDEPGEVVVAFSHPLCTECHRLVSSLKSAGRRCLVVDVRERADLARKYGIALVPTAVTVGRDGTVTGRIAG